MQSIHAAADFILKYPFLSYRWHKRSNYIAALSVRNEQELIALMGRLKAQRIRFTAFREPDIDNQITAIAIEPCPEAEKLCSGLPLALKDHSSGINKSTYKPKINNNENRKTSCVA